MHSPLPISTERTGELELQLLAGVVATEIFFPGAHVVSGILHPDIDTMPLSIVERMGRMIADRVLTAEFCGDFIKGIIQLRIGTIDRIAGDEPCLSATCVRNGIEDGHIDRVQISTGPARITRRELPPRWARQGNLDAARQSDHGSVRSSTIGNATRRAGWSACGWAALPRT